MDRTLSVRIRILPTEERLGAERFGIPWARGFEQPGMWQQPWWQQPMQRPWWQQPSQQFWGKPQAPYWVPTAGGGFAKQYPPGQAGIPYAYYPGQGLIQ